MVEKDRITILMDERILKKARTRQARVISEKQETTSLSKIINEDLAKQYKIQNFVY